MEVKVEYIGSLDDDRNDKIDAKVSFYKQIEEYGFSADVVVWVPKRDARISEIKNDVIQAAIDFLKQAQQSIPHN